MCGAVVVTFTGVPFLNPGIMLASLDESWNISFSKDKLISLLRGTF